LVDALQTGHEPRALPPSDGLSAFALERFLRLSRPVAPNAVPGDRSLFYF